MSAIPTFESCFPASTKVHLDGPGGVRVPMREISLSGGEPPLRVYDTSGPQGGDVRAGLPGVRAAWVSGRDRRGAVTQLHYARRGEITPEMEFVALREGLPAEFVRSEVARGGAMVRCATGVSGSAPPASSFCIRRPSFA